MTRRTARGSRAPCGASGEARGTAGRWRPAALSLWAIPDGRAQVPFSDAGRCPFLTRPCAPQSDDSGSWGRKRRGRPRAAGRGRGARAFGSWAPRAAGPCGARRAAGGGCRATGGLPGSITRRSRSRNSQGGPGGRQRRRRLFRCAAPAEPLQESRIVWTNCLSVRFQFGDVRGRVAAAERRRKSCPSAGAPWPIRAGVPVEALVRAAAAQRAPWRSSGSVPALGKPADPRQAGPPGGQGQYSG